jgi:hypothetical protein
MFHGNSLRSVSERNEESTCTQTAVVGANVVGALRFSLFYQVLRPDRFTFRQV